MAAPAIAANDKADGTGTANLFTPFGFHVGTSTINIKSDPGGANPVGTFRTTIPTLFGLVIDGNVTCLDVDGNRANVGGEITAVEPAGIVTLGTGTIGTHIDNGTPGDLQSGRAAPDQFNGVVLFGSPGPLPGSAICEAGTAITFPLLSGDYFVKEAGNFPAG